MKKVNYYLRVVKRKKEMKRNPHLYSWGKRKNLTKVQFERAIEAILAGKSSFEP